MMMMMMMIKLVIYTDVQYVPHSPHLLYHAFKATTPFVDAFVGERLL